MQKTLTKSLILTAILTTALGASYLFAAWTGPNQAPPGGNTETPIHIGSTNQVKDGGLSLDGLSVFGGGYFQGNVGIGTVSPGAKLDVAGKIKVSNDTSAPQAGNIRWTGTDFEGYDGTEWKSLTSGGGASLSPDSVDCINAGGNWVDAQAACYFRVNFYEPPPPVLNYEPPLQLQCPSGWSKKFGEVSDEFGISYYSPYTSTRPESCNFPGLLSCTTGSHLRTATYALESCTTAPKDVSYEYTCYASFIEVGCAKN